VRLQDVPCRSLIRKGRDGTPDLSARIAELEASRQHDVERRSGHDAEVAER
jgi:hypothetical protein